MRNVRKDKSMVRRLYVEKKRGFDVEAEELFSSIKDDLHLKGLKKLRILNRYDIDGIDDATYEAAKFTVFAEPAIDMLYEEKMPDDTRSAIFFAVEYLPGQYDQRADSAAQCIKLMSGGRKQAEDGQDAGDAVVKFARVIVLEGRLSSKEKEAVKNYCVNPVDSRIAAVEKPENLEMEQTEPEDVASIEGLHRYDGAGAGSIQERNGIRHERGRYKIRPGILPRYRKTPADSNGDKSNRYLLV